MRRGTVHGMKHWERCDFVVSAMMEMGLGTGYTLGGNEKGEVMK